MFKKDENLGQRKQPHDGHKEIKTVVKVHFSKGETRHPGLRVHTDRGQPKAKRGRKGGFRLIGGRHAAQRHEGQRKQREIFRRSEQQRDFHQLRGKEDQPPCRKERADKRCDTGQGQCFARHAFLRHGIAVKAGHHRGFIAGDIQQDRRNPTPVHRPVIDRGQQDQ